MNTTAYTDLEEIAAGLEGSDWARSRGIIPLIRRIKNRCSYEHLFYKTVDDTESALNYYNEMNNSTLKDIWGKINHQIAILLPRFISNTHF